MMTSSAISSRVCSNEDVRQPTAHLGRPLRADTPRNGARGDLFQGLLGLKRSRDKVCRRLLF